MFDFDRWCSWAEATAKQMHDGVIVKFKKGQSSAKQGAGVSFETPAKLALLEFWVSGEADFQSVDIATREGVLHFAGRLLTDNSFEQTFRECLALALDA